MGFLDDIFGQGTSDTLVDTGWDLAKGLIPTFGAAADLFEPKAASPALGGATGSWGPMDYIQGGGGMLGLDGMGLGLDMTATGGGRRRLIPISAGWPGPGYHEARRGLRRPSAGHPAGRYWVPNRRMNPLNPRALLKAEHRMGAFTHWVKRHFRIAAAAPRRRSSRKAPCFRRRRK